MILYNKIFLTNITVADKKCRLLTLLKIYTNVLNAMIHIKRSYINSYIEILTHNKVHMPL